ncbi:MAG TPA: RecQ family ATP-dependent DNA helicase [Gammaproteobacteria bacterium]|nr:RecQ family ATP-dependent DNA helicase [Gammaproteobacteria bacterium]
MRSSTALIEQCRRVARRTFGIERLRPEQESAMIAVLAGRDVLAVLPTGFGKSLIYQVPAMLLDRPTIVVSPLIALMTDQAHALERRRVPVVALHSRLGASTRRAALDRLGRSGRIIVLTTPETLEARTTAPFLERARPALLCIDEAHCISEWGHDFRPSYLRLGAIREQLGSPTALALTATATPRVRQDIAERLRLRAPTLVSASPHRENLRFSVEIVPSPLKRTVAARLIRRLRRPGIVYCATTTAVDQLFGALQRARIPAVRYHGKMRAADRENAQSQFMQPRRRLIMVATSAFGMGIDKPNIRYIVHYQVPGSLEQYVQEAGRAGRDGRPAQCILLFDAADLEIQKRLQALGRPNVQHLARLEHALAAWASEERAPSATALALSAGVPVRICEALLSNFESVGLIERDEEHRIGITVPLDRFRAGALELVAKLRRFRYEGERRLALVAEYARSEECRSVFLRTYFGEENPPRCGTCDRCRAAASAGRGARGTAREDRGRAHARRTTSALAASRSGARHNSR